MELFFLMLVFIVNIMVGVWSLKCKRKDMGILQLIFSLVPIYVVVFIVYAGEVGVVGPEYYLNNIMEMLLQLNREGYSSPWLILVMFILMGITFVSNIFHNISYRRNQYA